MLLEERIRENKINVLSNNNNNTTTNNNIGGASDPVEAGSTVNSKFKLKNIIQAKVQWSLQSPLSADDSDSFLSQIIDVDKADPLTGLVSWMKIETKQKTFDEKVPTVLGGVEYQVWLNCINNSVMISFQFVDPTPPPMKRV